MKLCIVAMAIAAFTLFPIDGDGDVTERTALRHEIGRAAAERAKISAKQALAAALIQPPEGELADIELSLVREAPVFKLLFLGERSTTAMTVDATTGAVRSRNEAPVGDAEFEQHFAMRKNHSSTKITIAEAVDAALTANKDATVIGAELAHLNGQWRYRITVVNDRRFKAYAVDASSKELSIEELKTDPVFVFIFETWEVGKAAGPFTFGFTHAETGKASWSITKDATAPSGTQVLTLSAESQGRTFNLALVPNARYQDIDVRAQVRANSGDEDQGGGVLWRCRDENNYYVCRINPLEGNFRVYKVVGGERNLLASAECETVTGKWHKVRAKMVGSEITCWVDGKKLLAARDEDHKDPGMVGLWTKADASTSFDDITFQHPGANSSKPTAKGGKDDKGSD
ncbi:MAG: PepSY domain-containing protein [Planctomycetota bacterium]